MRWRRVSAWSAASFLLERPVLTGAMVIFSRMVRCGEKIEMLENHAYMLAELIDVRSGRGNQLSLETDFSGGRFLQQVQAAQEGAFYRNRTGLR